MTDLLLEMEDEVDDTKTDYNLIIENAARITQAKEDAFYVYDVLALKEQEIREFEQISGINASAAWDLHNKAENEFKNERYQNAKERLAAITPKLDQIQVDATRLTTQLLAQKNRFVEWIKDNLLWILFVLLIFVTTSLFFYKKMELSLLQRNINHLHIEQEVLADLMKKAQRDYYKDGKITKSMYMMKTHLYKTRAEEIKTMLPVLQKELLKKIKRRESTKENNEKERREENKVEERREEKRTFRGKEKKNVKEAKIEIKENDLIEEFSTNEENAKEIEEVKLDDETAKGNNELQEKQIKETEDDNTRPKKTVINVPPKKKTKKMKNEVMKISPELFSMFDMPTQESTSEIGSEATSVITTLRDANKRHAQKTLLNSVSEVITENEILEALRDLENKPDKTQDKNQLLTSEASKTKSFEIPLKEFFT